MTKILPSLLIAALLTACGGGGDSPATSPASAAATPAPAAAPAPAPASAPALVTAPAAPAGTNFNVGKFMTTSSAGNYVLNFNATTDLTATGDLNNFWVSAAQAGGTVTINGASNTVVFKPSSIPTTVTVNGSANTFYLPEGSPITIVGTGAAMSSIKFYKP